MLVNSVLAIVTIAFNLAIQLLFVAALLRWLSRLQQRDQLGVSLRGILSVLLPSTILLFIGNVLQMVVWALLFVIVDEFETFGPAFYHSIVNFSTLGYGDIVMSPDHRILGAFEATNGILMLGLTTSTLYAVLREIMSQTRRRLERTQGT